MAKAWNVWNTKSMSKVWKDFPDKRDILLVKEKAEECATDSILKYLKLNIDLYKKTSKPILI